MLESDTFSCTCHQAFLTEERQQPECINNQKWCDKVYNGVEWCDVCDWAISAKIRSLVLRGGGALERLADIKASSKLKIVLFIEHCDSFSVKTVNIPSRV